MDMKLELVMVPVTDVDRAKEFYEKVGFTADHGRVTAASEWEDQRNACFQAVSSPSARRAAPSTAPAVRAAEYAGWWCRQLTLAGGGQAARSALDSASVV